MPKSCVGDTTNVRCGMVIHTCIARSEVYVQSPVVDSLTMLMNFVVLTISEADVE